MDRITVGQAINLALHDAMQFDSSVIMLGEDVADPEGGGVMGVTRNLSTTFGDNRVRSTPIAEQAIIGAGVGAALAGLRPVTEIMLMNFTTVAMDMIVNHAAKLRYMSGGQTGVPLTIRTMTGAGAGTAGQHSDYLEAWFAHVAGMKVVTFSTPADAYSLLLGAIFDNDPVLFIENITDYGTSGPAPERGKVARLGEAKVIADGKDVTLISYGAIMKTVLKARQALAKEGIDAQVIDLRTIAPFDAQTLIDNVSKTGRAVIIHEAVTEFGVGAEIAALLSERLHGKLKAPVRRIGSNFSAVPFSKVLEQAYVPSAGSIQEVVKSLMG
ncbi:pyruvate dehydrogenase E1 component beta subunit [Sphingobium faniae]|nr:pyruvate dehydrogenase E1 component beta subunit [Sphingobium faniae]